MTLEQIYQLIITYAPVVLMALGTILNFLKTFKELRNSKNEILNDPRMTGLRQELTDTRAELKVIKSQLVQIADREAKLVNQMAKVEIYEVGQNKKD